MTDLVRKLVADLKWRLSPAGRKYRPGKREALSWAPFRIPLGGAFLAWAAYLLFSILGAGQLLNLPDLAHLLIFGWPGWLATALLVFKGIPVLNRRFLVNAYRGLLENNERFSLVEYNRYLSRRIKQARADTSLGGAAEVARLKELQGQFVEMLRSGLGEGGLPVSSEIAEEADFAAAHIQAYRELAADPLEQLDTRMPEALMARVEELEREESALHSPEKQVEN